MQMAGSDPGHFCFAMVSLRGVVPANAGTHDHRQTSYDTLGLPACPNNNGLGLWIADRARYRTTLRVAGSSLVRDDERALYTSEFQPLSLSSLRMSEPSPIESKPVSA